MTNVRLNLLNVIRSSTLVIFETKTRGKENQVFAYNLGNLLNNTLENEPFSSHKTQRTFADATFAHHVSSGTVVVVSGTVSGVKNERDSPPDMLRRVDLLKIGPKGEMTWSSLPPLKKARWGCAAVLYSLPKNDKCLHLSVAGGATNNLPSKCIDVLKMEIDQEGQWAPSAQWMSLKPMIFGRHSATLVAIDDVMYLFAGKSGSGCSGSFLRESEWLDLNDEESLWDTIVDLPIGQHNGASVVIGRLIAILGGSTGVKDLDSVLVYDTAKDVWYSGPTLGHARSGHTAAIINGGGILVIGGHANKKPILEAELWIFGTNDWKNVGTLPRDFDVYSNSVIFPRSGTNSVYDADKLISTLTEINDLAESPWSFNKLKSLRKSKSLGRSTARSITMLTENGINRTPTLSSRSAQNVSSEVPSFCIGEVNDEVKVPEPSDSKNETPQSTNGFADEAKMKCSATLKAAVSKKTDMNSRSTLVSECTEQRDANRVGESLDDNINIGMDIENSEGCKVKKRVGSTTGRSGVNQWKGSPNYDKVRDISDMGGSEGGMREKKEETKSATVQNEGSPTKSSDKHKWSRVISKQSGRKGNSKTQSANKDESVGHGKNQRGQTKNKVRESIGKVSVIISESPLRRHKPQTVDKDVLNVIGRSSNSQLDSIQQDSSGVPVCGGSPDTMSVNNSNGARVSEPLAGKRFRGDKGKAKTYGEAVEALCKQNFKRKDSGEKSKHRTKSKPPLSGLSVQSGLPNVEKKSRRLRSSDKQKKHADLKQKGWRLRNDKSGEDFYDPFSFYYDDI